MWSLRPFEVLSVFLILYKNVYQFSMTSIFHWTRTLFCLRVSWSPLTAGCGIFALCWRPIEVFDFIFLWSGCCIFETFPVSNLNLLVAKSCVVAIFTTRKKIVKFSDLNEIWKGYKHDKLVIAWHILLLTRLNLAAICIIEPR